MPPATAALALCLPLAIGALAACGGSDAADGGTTSAPAARQAADAGFTMLSEVETPVGATQWVNGDWQPGASPGNINGSRENPNGIVLRPGQPVSVPVASKEDRQATFVLKLLGDRVTMKMQGATCIGFSNSSRPDLYATSQPLPGARISCRGEGFVVRVIPPQP